MSANSSNAATRFSSASKASVLRSSAWRTISSSPRGLPYRMEFKRAFSVAVCIVNNPPWKKSDTHSPRLARNFRKGPVRPSPGLASTPPRPAAVQKGSDRERGEWVS